MRQKPVLLQLGAKVRYAFENNTICSHGKIRVRVKDASKTSAWFSKRVFCFFFLFRTRFLNGCMLMQDQYYDFSELEEAQICYWEAKTVGITADNNLHQKNKTHWTRRSGAGKLNSPWPLLLRP